MATRKEKVNAGLFLLIGIVLLASTIAIVVGVTLEREGAPYLIKIPKSVGGLREGSIVKYLGVTVGKVKTVDFPLEDLESVRVLIEITRPSTPIRPGTFATLSSNFLTGETSLELQGGGNDEPRIGPGALIPWRPTTLMRLEDSLPGATDELRRIVASLNLLVGPENQERVRQLADNANALILEAHAQLGPITSEARALREALAGASDRIAVSAAGLRVDVTKSVNDGVGSLKAAAKSIETVATRLTVIAEKLESGADEVPQAVQSITMVATQLAKFAATADLLVDDNRDGVRRTLDELEVAVASLAALLEQLDRNPSHLIFSDPPVEHVRGAVSSGTPVKGGA